jgi:hypothetical protein
MSELGGASLNGYSPQMSGYSPADFSDAVDTQPTEIYLDPTGTGTNSPYATAVGNALNRSIREVRQANPHPPIIQDNWKRKYRDFLNSKNEDLVGFLSKKLPDHSTITRTQNFFRKYGTTELKTNNDRFFDVSSNVPYVTTLDAELQAIGKSSYVELVMQVKYLMELYKDTGEKVLRTEGLLRAKLDAFDKVVSKVQGFGDLRQNTAFQTMMGSIQEYLTTVFEENKIEETYHELVEHYKKLHFLRESLQFLWSIEASQRESLCSICFNEPIQFALVPCGHTFCMSCSKRQMMSCCICRNSIRERVKLFIG